MERWIFFSQFETNKNFSTGNSVFSIFLRNLAVLLVLANLIVGSAIAKTEIIGDSQLAGNLGLALNKSCIGAFKDYRMTGIGSSAAPHYLSNKNYCLGFQATYTMPGKVHFPMERDPRCKSKYAKFGNHAYQRFQEVIQPDPSGTGTVYVFLGDNSASGATKNHVNQSVEMAKKIRASGRSCVWGLPALKMREASQRIKPTAEQTVAHNKEIAKALEGLCQLIDPSESLTKGTAGVKFPISDTTHYTSKGAQALAARICVQISSSEPNEPEAVKN